ncbi:MAG: heme exporter protein CcmB [Thermoflexales bacterium]|nr:heme exporter protein CcmB [Thermoflexales bacterium]
MSYLRAVLAILRKDALTELRARETVISMLVFATLAIVMFNFALRTRVDAIRPLVPGLIWVTLVFAATLGLGRAMSSEQVNQCIDGLLLAPGDRSAIFVGKALGNVLFTLLVAALLVPLMSILMDEGLFNAGVALSLFIGVLGFSGAGTLVATIAISTRAREVILPILLLPVTLPLVTTAALATGGFLDGQPLTSILPWLGVELGFVVVFWAAGTLLYDFVLDA